MGLFDGLIRMSIKKNLAKWIAGAGTMIVAVGAPYIAQQAGIELTDEQKAKLAIAVGAAIVGMTNAVKQHLPEKYKAYIP